MSKEEIKVKANNILEETKNKQEEYKEERTIIFQLLNDSTEKSLEMLEKIIKIYQKEKELKRENQTSKELLTLKQKIEVQKIRKIDGKFVEKIAVFLVKDKQGKKHKFLIRENANKFVEENKSNLKNDVSIEIEQNEYFELEQILKDS